MTPADEARRIEEETNWSDGCAECADSVGSMNVERQRLQREIAAALAAAERRGIMAAAHEINRIRFTDYAVIGCRLQWHAAFDLEMAVRALLPECSGISGELPAEPAAKCARCNGSGVTSAPYEFDAEDCPSCGGAR